MQAWFLKLDRSSFCMSRPYLEKKYIKISNIFKWSLKFGLDDI